MSRVFMKSLAVWVCLLWLCPCGGVWQVANAEKPQKDAGGPFSPQMFGLGHPSTHVLDQGS